MHAFESGVVDVFYKVDLLILFEVGHATVADLDCVAVKDFVEHINFPGALRRGSLGTFVQRLWPRSC